MATRKQRSAPRRGSILVIMLVTLVFAAAALVAFMDKASNDLLVAAHVTVADRLRMDAYSALDTTLAVLEDFKEADAGLHSPSEGWGTPLDWAGWVSPSGNTVEVSFQDESGKISIGSANATVLNNMFTTVWALPQDQAQHLTDVLLAWMHKDYVSSSGIPPDYEQSTIPYDPPLRALRSFKELAAIDFVKETLFDELGRPNALWWRFYNDFSLFKFGKPDINGANADVLAGLGNFSDNQQQNIADFLSGGGTYKGTSPTAGQWFSGAESVVGVVGGATGTPGAFSTTISALRILITVHQAAAVYRLSVVVAPQGGATTVTATASDTKQNSANGTSGETTANNGLNSTSPNQSASTATAAQQAAATTAGANLQYPFTILEITENDAILTPPPPPPPTTL